MQQWPELGAADRPTIITLHLISQIVGKVATRLLPWRNHGWHLTLHVTPRGLKSEPVHGAGPPFELEIDLMSHCVRLTESAGDRSIPIGPTTISSFYAAFVAMLAESGRTIAIHDSPNEVDPAVPFPQDNADRVYDRDAAQRLLGALGSAQRVFAYFRSSFLGKVSPVHFFWGSFDLAVTRFSGRRAPPHPGGVPNLPDAVTREAYSHEVSSAGFWPGGAGGPGGPFFYAYAYPAPDGFAAAPVQPDAAHFDQNLGEFVLDYDAVRTAADPDAAVMAFLESTYDAAADLAKWERSALECGLGRADIPRPVPAA